MCAKDDTAPSGTQEFVKNKPTSSQHDNSTTDNDCLILSFTDRDPRGGICLHGYHKVFQYHEVGVGWGEA